MGVSLLIAWSPVGARRLPEDVLKDSEEDCYACCPEDGSFVDRQFLLNRDLSVTVDDVLEFRFWLRGGVEADDHGDNNAGEPGPDRTVQILCHLFGVWRKSNDGQVGMVELDQRKHGDRCDCARKEPPEA